jgi:phage portal protein BeeE
VNPIERTLREWVSKAVSVAVSASRGVISEWVPSPASYGQPRRLSNDSYGQISPQRMREIVLKTPTAGGAMNAILDYASGVEVGVRNTDPAEKPPARAAKLVTSLLTEPNAQDDSREFRRKLLRDLLVLGFAAVEIEPGASGAPAANLYVLDSGNLRVDFDQHGSILGFTQFDVNGKPILGKDGVHTFLPDEVIYYQLDPKSESRYPMSRIEQLFACAVIEQLMLSYIGARFTDGNIPFGVMDLGDITEDEVKAAVALWNEQVEEFEHPEHRIVFTGSRGGANYIQFTYNLSELEAPNLLSAIRMYILSILGVTVNEMGEADNVNKANGFNLSFTFKKRAIEPLLDVFVTKTTRHLIKRVLGIDNLELYYEDIDSRDELLEAQIEDMYLKAGIYSINYVRNKKGLPSIDGGDEPMIHLGSAVLPISMLHDFAQVQLEALQMINLQTHVAIMQAMQAMSTPQVGPDGKPVPGTGKPPDLQALGTLPLMRVMQPPERFTTPDASGSSSFKFNMPAPNMQTQVKPRTAAAPTKPRGPVETAQRAGVRKDN